MSTNNSFQRIQDVLSLGYIYLIVMGILYQTLLYNQIGVDILNYSSILDVLIKPISIMTSDFYTFGGFVFLIFMTFSMPNYLAKKRKAGKFKSAFKLDDNLTEKEMEQSIFIALIVFLAFGLFGFYFGTGAARGLKWNRKIEANKVAFNDQLDFVNGTTDTVEIIGKNSSYIFYVKEETKKVMVTPISGVIKSIEEDKEHFVD